MAKRYTQKQKDEVVAFVKKHNQTNGRGGQSAAVKKYDINPITVRKWCVTSGILPENGKTAKKKKSSANKPTTQTSQRSSRVSVLQRMLRLSEQIEQLQGEFAGLKAQL